MCPGLEENEVVDERALDPEEMAAAVESATRVSDLLDCLSPERRIVFVMKAIEQMTLAEIAEALEVNVNTVGSRYRLACVDLTKAYTRREASNRARRQSR